VFLISNNKAMKKIYINIPTGLTVHTNGQKILARELTKENKTYNVKLRLALAIIFSIEEQ
jgi:hypothetical protein